MQCTTDKRFINYGENREIVSFVENDLSNIRQSGYFKGKNDLDVFYEKFVIDNEIGRIVISHGFTECIEKYNELIFYFIKRGYSVFALEHRGHGRSGFLGKMSKSQVSVEKFDYYVEDLKTFIDNIAFKENSNMYLFAHSLGGAIATSFLEKYDGYFKKAILSAPMMEINTGNYSKKATYFISKFFIKIGKGENYIFGQGPFKSEYDLDGSGTSNKYRYKSHFDYLIKNENLQRSAGSFKWLNECLKATDEILKEENIKKIKIPVLLFQAGRDTFVKPEGHNIFEKYAENCKVVKFEKGKHELYIENDDILDVYLEKLFEFFK